MGEITLGDVAMSGILTLVVVLLVGMATAIVTMVLMGLSSDLSFAVFVITMVSIFVGGGLLLGGRSHAAGYPVLRIWAFLTGIFLLLFYLPMFVWSIASGRAISGDILLWMLIYIGALSLAVFFSVALAGFLNSRGISLVPPRTFGSVPGQFGMTIYRSNQPAIYEGIREVDLKVETPGSLYRGRQ
jgi:hypothetical protein